MLHLHRAERADRLAAALGELLASPLEDEFALELVAVPTRGMERWLAQQLSAHLGSSPDRGDGICAGVRFPPPRRLIADALAAASGVDPENDPWLPERSAWTLLELIDDHLGEPWLRGVAKYLGATRDPPDELRRARRLGLVRHLADLFERYALARPEMVSAWARGADLDATGTPLRDDARWQAELWRALRERIGEPGPAERLGPACRQLREDADLLALPPRLSLFGLTRLPAGDLEVLSALAEPREVHLFLLHPSPALWAQIASLPRPAVRRVPRGKDPTAGLAANPLLASWGRDAREMQLGLTAGTLGQIDRHHPLSRAAGTLLQRLQDAVVKDQAPPGDPLTGEPDARPVLAPADRSVQIHACHGRARQVEVLRDAVLHALAESPDLEPRDVIVMCPDVEAFAPLIQATFGAADIEGEGERPDSGPGDLRVRLADRSLRQTNPVLAAVSELLELAGQRLTASQVLGFADRDPVRRRFGLRDEDLTRLQRWIADAGIRWGLDAAHRAPFKLEALSGGTWQAGLDRLLLGVAMTEDACRLIGGVLPLDDVESGAIDLAGRFAELIARLGEAVDQLSAIQPLGSWARALAGAADSLTATGPRESWQRMELGRLLDELVAEAGAAPGAPRLAPAEVRELLAERLAGRPTRANFRTGHLTVCTLYPMRSVPHPVVCLLGLDDGAFPRRRPRDGDDLLLDDPHVGERDPRSEDRQLLLDALMAAEQRLIITYTGNDERTNLPRPPAVPVGELLDVIDATARTAQGAARGQVLIRHPLQAFDRRNFAAGALSTPGPWSFDRVMLAGARALERPRSAPPAFLDAPLTDPPSPVLALEDLVRFVQHPVRAFLRQRLRVYLGDIEDEVDDALPVELDGLERWGVGQRLLDAALAGTDDRRACLAEVARGTLPPGQLGAPVVFELFPVARTIANAAAEVAPADARPDPIDIHVELPGGRLLGGTVSAGHGDVLLAATFSRVGAKHRLSAWVRLLAATAAAPERPLSAVTIGRSTRGDDIKLIRIAPLGEDPVSRRDVATSALAELVDLYDAGLREPLPLYCRTSAAYAEAWLDGEDALGAAHRQWESGFNFDGEDRELEHQLVLGGERRFAEILSASRPGQSGFEALARRLWEPILRREVVNGA